MPASANYPFLSLTFLLFPVKIPNLLVSAKIDIKYFLNSNDVFVEINAKILYNNNSYLIFS